jgi:soluble lytic murein transglycosylase-like protein
MIRQTALAAVVALAFAPDLSVAEEASAGARGFAPVATAKRLTPPQPGTTRRIMVQIDPAEQALALATLPPFPAARAPAGDGPEASADAATAYPWFWEAVSPARSQATPGRLDQAIIALSGGPAGTGVPTPRMQSMQAIAEKYGADILKATIGTRVSPALVLAVIGIESAGRVDAVSNKGATGLMQLMPATAKRFGVSDITVPTENIRGGVAYLNWLMGEFGGDPMMVLAGYNAGEGAVQQHGGVPPYRETRDYVPKVLAAWTVARGLCLTPPELLSDGCVFRIAVAGL